MSNAKVIGLVSQKGGVGKSTLSMLMADCLHHQGKSVLVIDTDPQRTAQKWEQKTLEGYPRFPVQVVEASRDLTIKQFASLLAERSKDVDYILVDTPPNLSSPELKSTLYIADKIIIPFTPHTTSIDALEELVPVIDKAEIDRGEAINVRVLLNRVDYRRTSERAIVDSAAKICPYKIMRARLKNLSAYADVANYRTSLYALSVSKEARDSIEAVVKEACK